MTATATLAAELAADPSPATLHRIAATVRTTPALMRDLAAAPLGVEPHGSVDLLRQHLDALGVPRVLAAASDLVLLEDGACPMVKTIDGLVDYARDLQRLRDGCRAPRANFDSWRAATVTSEGPTP